MNPTFQQELEALLIKHGQDMGSNTPVHLLANYIIKSLETFNATTRQREDWFNPTNDDR